MEVHGHEKGAFHPLKAGRSPVPRIDLKKLFPSILAWALKSGKEGEYGRSFRHY